VKRKGKVNFLKPKRNAIEKKSKTKTNKLMMNEILCEAKVFFLLFWFIKKARRSFEFDENCI
jgi:hypothetical protein